MEHAFESYPEQSSLPDSKYENLSLGRTGNDLSNFLHLETLQFSDKIKLPNRFLIGSSLLETFYWQILTKSTNK